MTTKQASKVQEFPVESLEKIAYASAASIPTKEPNDCYRLGYHIFRWLQSKQGTLEQAISESGVRMTIPKEKASQIIVESLQKKGICL